MTALAVQPDRHPWERIPGESAKAYAAFCIYRDLLDARSLTTTAERVLETSTTRKTTKVESVRRDLGDWSVKYRWVERSDAYLDHLDARWREQRESDIEIANRRTREAGALLTTLGLRRFHGGTIQTNDGERVVAPVDINDATIADALRLIVEGIKMTRLGTGLPTEMLSARVTISAADHVKVLDLVINECALPLIPPELHDRFFTSIERLAAR